MGDKSEGILELLHAGMAAKDIAAVLNVGRRTVYDVKNRFRLTGSAARRKRGPKNLPNSQKAVNPSNSSKIRKRIERNPRRSMRQMAAEIGVSEASVRRIVKKLGLKSRAVQTRPLLTQQMRQNRVIRAKRLLNDLKSAHPGRVIIFSDEKLFRTDAKVNRRNDRYISAEADDAEDSVRFAEKTKNAPSVMFLGLVTSDGRKAPPIFLDGKVNADVYISALRDVAVPWMQAEFPDGNFVFQQDSAPAHTAKKTVSFLQEAGIPFWPKDFWPPNSPDANPLDFGIWARLETKTNASAASSVAALRTTIRRQWADMSDAFVARVCRSFRRRLEQIVEADGGRIE